jgi:uncharacterized protein (DUF2236 family)
MAAPVVAGTSPVSAGSSHDDRFRRYLGTYFFAPFAGAFFDQPMLPEVAAGVEWTGRIRRTPFQRALRSAAVDQLVMAGSSADNAAVGNWLREAHWNWIMASAIVGLQAAYTPITGEKLSDADRQQFYQLLLDKFEYVQLPGKKSRLPADYSELLDWYESVLNVKGEHNIAVANAVASLKRPPRPPFVPVILTPLWRPVGDAVGHVASVCSFGIMHPKARALTGVSRRSCPSSTADCQGGSQCRRWLTTTGATRLLRIATVRCSWTHSPLAVRCAHLLRRNRIPARCLTGITALASRSGRWAAAGSWPSPRFPRRGATGC